MAVGVVDFERTANCRLSIIKVISERLLIPCAYRQASLLVQQQKKPNILVIWGDDIGHDNINTKELTMSLTRNIWLGLLASFAAVMAMNMPASAQQPQRPNIVFIMADDIGWANVGVYNQGMMAVRTPNLDQLASEGMRFTDYYAEASCTAGRANFITGPVADPHRIDHRRSGRFASRHARRGANDCHRAQVHGLRHRPVRQEPSGRPEQVPAHAARLR